MEAYNAGQRLFGENRPQEFAMKCKELPQDIQWHFIGHLQTNKLKLVLPYAYMVQSVDSIHLLEDIEKWGSINDKVIRVLLELHLGAEETKHGLTEDEITEILNSVSKYPHVRFCGISRGDGGKGHPPAQRPRRVPENDRAAAGEHKPPRRSGNL